MLGCAGPGPPEKACRGGQPQPRSFDKSVPPGPDSFSLFIGLRDKADTLFIWHGEASEASLLGPVCECGVREKVLPSSSPASNGSDGALQTPGSSEPSPHCSLATSTADPLATPPPLPWPVLPSGAPQGAQLYHAPHSPSPTPSSPESRDPAQGPPLCSTPLSSQDYCWSLLRPAGPHPCPLRLLSSGQAPLLGPALPETHTMARTAFPGPGHCGSALCAPFTGPSGWSGSHRGLFCQQCLPQVEAAHLLSCVAEIATLGGLFCPCPQPCLEAQVGTVRALTGFPHQHSGMSFHTVAISMHLSLARGFL